MVLVYIPHGSGVPSDSTRFEPHVGLSHYACGFLGLAVAFAVLAFGYSMVLAVASVVPLLSTTAVVFLGIAIWVTVWLLLDLLVERVRRPTPDGE